MAKQSNISNALPIVAAHYGEKFGVKVIVSGSQASTDGKSIIVPNVPESYPNKDVVWGYLVHEAAHVRFSDFQVLSLINPDDHLRMAVLNTFEDARIEYAIIREFPGVRLDIDSMASFMRDAGHYQMVTASHEPVSIFQSKLLYWLCVNVLEQPLVEFSRAADLAMEAVFPQGFIHKLEDLLRQVTAVQDTKECLVLVDKVLSMLDEEACKEESSSGTNADADADADSDADSTVISSVINAQPDDLNANAYEALKNELFDHARQDGDNSYCTVHSAPDSKSDVVAGAALLNRVRGTTSKLRAQLLSLVQSSRRSNDRARTRGRKLDAKRINRIVTGDTRIFRSREDKVQPNTAVHLLADLSSSMQGGQEIIAREASLAIALALEGIPGVNPAVTFFSGDSNDPVRSALRHGESAKRHAHRFNESARGWTPMAEGIWHGAYELLKTKEPRKLMMVITDGHPDNQAACTTVIDLCHNSGIETVGIGIRHDGVKKLFERSIVIDSVEQLRSTLFELVREKLTAQAA